MENKEAKEPNNKREEAILKHNFISTYKKWIASPDDYRKHWAWDAYVNARDKWLCYHGSVSFHDCMNTKCARVRMDAVLQKTDLRRVEPAEICALIREATQTPAEPVLS